MIERFGYLVSCCSRFLAGWLPQPQRDFGLISDIFLIIVAVAFVREVVRVAAEPGT